MGLAKYAEDDMEIMIERQIFRKNKGQDRRLYGTQISGEATKSLSEVNRETVSAQETNRKPSSKEPTYTDKILLCKCCGQRFLFSAYAQKEYEKNGWCAPKRCKPCRRINKMSKAMRQSFR